MSVRDSSGALSSARSNCELGLTEASHALKTNGDLLKLIGLVVKKVQPLRQQDLMSPLFATWESMDRAGEALRNGYEDVTFAAGRDASLPAILDPLRQRSRDLAAPFQSEGGENTCRQATDALYESLAGVTAALATLIENAEAAQTHAVTIKNLLEHTTAEGGAMVNEIKAYLPR
jgi:hypothetical protein